MLVQARTVSITVRRVSNGGTVTAGLTWPLRVPFAPARAARSDKEFCGLTVYRGINQRWTISTILELCCAEARWA